MREREGQAQRWLTSPSWGGGPGRRTQVRDNCEDMAEPQVSCWAPGTGRRRDKRRDRSWTPGWGPAGQGKVEGGPGAQVVRAAPRGSTGHLDRQPKAGGGSWVVPSPRGTTAQRPGGGLGLTLLQAGAMAEREEVSCEPPPCAPPYTGEGTAPRPWEGRLATPRGGPMLPPGGDRTSFLISNLS